MTEPKKFCPASTKTQDLILNPLAQEMAECIITKGRAELQKYYPNAIYEGETTDEANSSANPKTFPEPLTLDLLEKHQELSESCK